MHRPSGPATNAPERASHAAEEALVMLTDRAVSTKSKIALNRKGVGFLVPRLELFNYHQLVTCCHQCRRARRPYY